MHKSDLEPLLIKYIQNTISKSELEVLMRYLYSIKDLDEESDTLSLVEKYGIDKKLEKERRDAIFGRVTRLIDAKTRERKRKTFLKYAIAALIVLAGVGLIMNYDIMKTSPDQVMLTSGQPDILLPGTDSVYIEFADGTDIALDLSNKEVPVHAGAFEISVLPDGSIVCVSNQQHYTMKGGDIGIRTAKGSTIRIHMPDQTIVWLNSNSVINLSQDYGIRDRKVDLTGEAYFDVSASENISFQVTSRGSKVQVLGTEFNVAAYPYNGVVKTTLVEGSVAVLSSLKTINLQPGQQSAVDVNTGGISIKEVNPDSYISWKDGYFTFTDEPIEAILNRISQWYDIEKIDLIGEVDGQISGTFERSKSLRDLLQNIEKITALKFEISESTLKVSKANNDVKEEHN